MRKLIRILLVFSFFLNIYGCQNVDRKEMLDYKEIEIANRHNDEDLIDKAKNIYTSNLSKAQEDEERQVATVKYLDDIYQIASTRVNLDLDILNVFSEDYETYIATMQAYSEVYLKERRELVKNQSLSKKENSDKTSPGKMLKLLYQAIDEQEKETLLGLFFLLINCLI